MAEHLRPDWGSLAGSWARWMGKGNSNSFVLTLFNVFDISIFCLGIFDNTDSIMHILIFIDFRFIFSLASWTLLFLTAVFYAKFCIHNEQACSSYPFFYVLYFSTLLCLCSTKGSLQIQSLLHAKDNNLLSHSEKSMFNLVMYVILCDLYFYQLNFIWHSIFIL